MIFENHKKKHKEKTFFSLIKISKGKIIYQREKYFSLWFFLVISKNYFFIFNYFFSTKNKIQRWNFQFLFFLNARNFIYFLAWCDMLTGFNCPCLRCVFCARIPGSCQSPWLLQSGLHILTRYTVHGRGAKTHNELHKT